MIHFYILMFLGFALIVASVIFACTVTPSWKSLSRIVTFTILLGFAICVAALIGAVMHRGYTYFDPSVCVQMVYDQDSRKWVCVTWEEAG